MWTITEGNQMQGKCGRDVRGRLRRLYDRSLVLRFQIGDDAAFEEIVAMMHARLRHFVVSAFHIQPADADDLLQDVWLKACGHLRRLREPASLRSWLYSVTRNMALKHLRRRKPVTSFDASQVPARQAREAQVEHFADLRAAIATLSPEHREVVVMRFEEGLSYEDIAGALGCPVGTVRSRLHCVKNILHGKLGRSIDDKS